MLEGSSEDSKTNRAGDSGWQPSCPSRTSQYRDSFGTDLSDPPKEQTKSPRTSWQVERLTDSGPHFDSTTQTWLQLPQRQATRTTLRVHLGKSFPQHRSALTASAPSSPSRSLTRWRFLSRFPKITN